MCARSGRDFKRKLNHKSIASMSNAQLALMTKTALFAEVGPTNLTSHILL